MNQTYFLNLIDKYFHKDLEGREMDELLEWLRKPEYKRVFEDYVEINYILNQTKAIDVKETYEKIDALLKQNQTENNNQNFYLKYAAVFIGLLGLGYLGFLFTQTKLENSSEGQSFVTIEKEDGTVEVIDQEEKAIFDSEGLEIGTNKKNRITYNEKKEADQKDTSSEKEIQYNTLYVPKGKTYKLVLSDGTEVTLNADSKITFPVNFVADKKRAVALKGEAYFDVVRDSSRQFIVKTEAQNIEVYGTEFNVTSYEDDVVCRTILVNGSVGVSNSIAEVRLKPGEMVVSQQKEEDLEVETVDTHEFTAWLENKLIFRQRTFEEITKVLERKYDVTIRNEYEELNQQKFTATFKEKDIEQIFDLFSKSRAFTYSKEGQEITITKTENNR